MTEQDLGKLLEQCETDKGRACVVLELIGKESIPEEYIEQAIQFYSSTGNEAGIDIAARAGFTERAVDMCLAMGRINAAIEYAQKGGLHKKAKEMAEVEIKKYLDANDVDSAVAVAQKGYGYARDRIVEIYKSQGMFLSAARTSSYANKARELFLKAIEKFEENGEFSQAAEVCQVDLWVPYKLREFAERALDNFIKAEEFTKAARLAKDLELTEQTSELYEKAINQALASKRKSRYKEHIKRAASLAEEAGYPERGIAILEEHGCFDVAAQVAKKLGLEERAGELYDKQIALWEKQGHLDSALSIAQTANREDKVKSLSLRMMEKHIEEGRWDRAQEVISRAGLKEKEMEIAESRGHYRIAAELAEKLGLKEKAQAYKSLAQLLWKHREREPMWSPP